MEYKKLIYKPVLKPTSSQNFRIFGWLDQECTRYINTSRVKQILVDDGEMYVVTMNSVYKLNDPIRSLHDIYGDEVDS